MRVTDSFGLNPFIPLASPKWPDNFDDISLTKAIFRKDLKENRSSELYLQLSFKHFANLYLIPKLFSYI